MFDVINVYSSTKSRRSLLEHAHASMFRLRISSGLAVFARLIYSQYKVSFYREFNNH